MSATDRANAQPRSAFEEPLISVGEASLDRMPALTLIFDEAAAAFTKTLEEFSEIPAALSFEDLDAKRVGELQEHCGALKTLFVYEAGGLDSKLAVAVDDAFRDLAVELLLGSSVVESTSRSDRRSSTIDTHLVEFAVGRFLDGVKSALAPITESEFLRDPLGDEATFAAIGQKGAVAIVCRCKLKSFDHEGHLAFAIPRAAIDPFRAALSRFPGGDGAVQDERWSENLFDHIARTEVRVHVVMESRELTLDDVARFEVGDVVKLPIAPTSLLRVESEGRTLFWCALGQKDGSYTVRIEEFCDERQEFIQDLLGV